MLGSTVPGTTANNGSGTSFTYNLDLTITDSNEDITLTFSDTGGGSFGEAFLAGYTVTTTSIPEPSTSLLLSLAGIGGIMYRRR